VLHIKSHFLGGGTLHAGGQKWPVVETQFASSKYVGDLVHFLYCVRITDSDEMWELMVWLFSLDQSAILEMVGIMSALHNALCDLRVVSLITLRVQELWVHLYK